MKISQTHIIYLLLTVCALTLYVLRQIEISIPFLSNYGNDILFVPLLLFYAETLMYYFHKPFKISAVHILFTIMYTSLMFEWIFPALSNEYTSDYLDILCYISGGIIYTSIQKMRVIGKSVTI